MILWDKNHHGMVDSTDKSKRKFWFGFGETVVCLWSKKTFHAQQTQILVWCLKNSEVTIISILGTQTKVFMAEVNDSYKIFCENI